MALSRLFSALAGKSTDSQVRQPSMQALDTTATGQSVSDVQPTPAMPPQPNQAVEIASSFLSGSAAGATVAYTLFPFEAFKKYMQRYGITPASLFNYSEMKRNFAREAFYPYRGSAVFAVNIVPTTAIQLTSETFLKSVMPETNSVYSQIGISVMSGVFGAITATPVENFVARSQALNATGTIKYGNLEVMADLYKQSLLRPWKSYPLIATRDGIFTFCMLWASPTASQKAQELFGESRKVDVAARFAVSLLGATVSHIPDTLATLSQITHNRVSVYETARSIIARNGYAGFLAGLPPRFALFFAFSNAIPYVQKVTNPYADQVVRNGMNRLGLFGATKDRSAVEIKASHETSLEEAKPSRKASK